MSKGVKLILAMAAVLVLADVAQIIAFGLPNPVKAPSSQAGVR